MKNNIHKTVYIGSVIVFSSIICFSCKTPIVSSLKKGDSKVKLEQVSSIQKKTEKASGVYTSDTEKALNEGYTTYEKDKKTGKDIMNVNLREVIVVAKSRNIPERNGKITLDFKITVPEILINDKWQVRLTPIADKNSKKIQFDKIFISGADFLKKQKHGYQMYQNFVNSIIPDSAYMQMLFDTKGYQKALNDIEEMFYIAWQKDLLSQDRFIDWKNINNRRVLLFNGIMERNKASVSPADWRNVLPAYRLSRTSDVPSEWKTFEKNGSIKQSQMTAKDSIELSKKFFDYKRMAENERKKASIQNKYKELVLFPQEECKLDTIIKNGDRFEYFYKQTIDADENIKKILLTVHGNVLATDLSTIDLPKSDTITYYVSSMVQFLDHRPRYKKIIISRHAQANTRAMINFGVGSTKYIETENNKKEVDKVLETLHKLTFTGELALDSIYMTATASPEGSSKLNYNLSQGRAQSLKRHLSSYLDPSDLKLISARAIGEDWDELKNLLKNDSILTWSANPAIDIIEKYPNFDNREYRFRQLPDYGYIKERLYPKLRAVKFDFYLHRKEMTQDTIHTTVIDTAYMEAINKMENRQYKAALKTLNEYNDYNTAVCLMSLGYDSRAINILLKEEKTSSTLYLLAILYAREGKEEMALEAFKRSMALDSSKFYRGSLDPEINKIITKYKISL